MTPADKLAGLESEINRERDRKLVSVANNSDINRLRNHPRTAKKIQRSTEDKTLLRSNLSTVHPRSWKQARCSNNGVTPFPANFAPMRKTFTTDCGRFTVRTLHRSLIQASANSNSR